MRLNLIILASALSLSVQAQQPDIGALQACTTIKNDLQRVKCYDTLIKPTLKKAPTNQVDVIPAITSKPTQKAQDTKPVQSTVQAQEPQKNQTVQVAQTNADDDFGRVKKVPADQIKKVVAKVTNIERLAHQRRRFTLENGQVWAETQATLFTCKVGDTVEIKRSMLNSFKMRKNGSSRSAKVKRVN